MHCRLPLELLESLARVLATGGTVDGSPAPSKEELARAWFAERDKRNAGFIPLRPPAFTVARPWAELMALIGPERELGKVVGFVIARRLLDLTHKTYPARHILKLWHHLKWRSGEPVTSNLPVTFEELRASWADAVEAKTGVRPDTN